jgi:membrane protein YqaA with SNARE-associated domain
MLMWLGVSVGVAFGSALLPIISVEIFLIGLVSQEPDVPWLALAAAIAVGQMAGKLLYYYAAKGSIRLPAFLQRKPAQAREPSPRRDRWSMRTKRLRSWAERLTERCHRHPHVMFGTFGLSAVVGVPPFLAMSIVAGLVRMKVSAFLSAGLVGRFIRFSALAAAPALCAGWLF